MASLTFGSFLLELNGMLIVGHRCTAAEDYREPAPVISVFGDEEAH